MKLIIGLGNPGKEYENTRHNAGFRFLDTYANEKNLTFNKEKFNGLYTDFIHNDEKIILLKPQKYMNLSGEVIKEYMDYFKIDKEDNKYVYEAKYQVDFKEYKYKIDKDSGNILKFEID